jgi:twitching motility protein PilI
MSNSLDPFVYLTKLAKQVKLAAPELPAQREIRDTWSGIGFSVLGHRFVAPLGEVVEMLVVPEITRLPGTQDWVMGLSNVRGRLLPLFDLEAFFGAKLASNKVRHRVLVIELGELYAGLIVSDVYGMQAIPEDLELDSVIEKLAVIGPYSDGAFMKEGLQWTTFSPFSLIRDPRFFDASAA